MSRSSIWTASARRCWSPPSALWRGGLKGERREVSQSGTSRNRPEENLKGIGDRSFDQKTRFRTQTLVDRLKSPDSFCLRHRRQRPTGNIDQQLFSLQETVVCSLSHSKDSELGMTPTFLPPCCLLYMMHLVLPDALVWLESSTHTSWVLVLSFILGGSQ